MNSSLVQIYATLSLMVGCLSSCLDNTVQHPKTTTYYDLKDYFEKKQILFTKYNAYLEKSATLQGVTRKTIEKRPDWNKELIFFREADLNKPSWRGKYRVYYFHHNLVYEAMDTSHLSIRKVILYHCQEASALKVASFDSIRIEKKESNILSKMEGVFVFKPDSAYTIFYKQDIRFYRKVLFFIKGNIHR